ncbi:hypothetical protein [Taibaiella koreensis]|uniref:hypothetical protein n=1 Tax=Taibaiella koreensis TaxID=1268548 RepID=UPI0013C37528|nr:hypothetical protein [Taibaiella koreensis]
MKKIIFLFAIGGCMLTGFQSMARVVALKNYPVAEKSSGSSYFSKDRSADWGNSMTYSYQVDLGYLAEGQVYDFKMPLKSGATYPNPGPNYWLNAGDVLGYLIPEESGIQTPNMFRNVFSASVDTKDQKGSFEQVVKVSTKYGMFYFTIKAFVVDGAVLQALAHTSQPALPKDK